MPGERFALRRIRAGFTALGFSNSLEQLSLAAQGPLGGLGVPVFAG